MGRPNGVRYRADRDAWVSKIGGRLVTLAKGRYARAEALRALGAILDGLKAPRPVRTMGGPSLGRLAVEWGKDLDARVAAGRYKESTARLAKQRVARLVMLHGDLPAAELKPHHVEAWADDHPGWSRTTRWCYLAQVKTMTRWGWRRGLLEVDPLARLVCGTPGRRRTDATAADARRWLEAIPSPSLRGLLTFVYLTGCRPGEAANLEAGQVKGDLATLEEHKTRHRTGEARVIVLGPDAVKLVKAAAAVRPDGPLWVTARGNRWGKSSMARECRTAREASGVRLTPYLLRHLYATDLLARGEPVAVVSALMGHTSPGITLRVYSHVTSRLDDLRKAARKRR